MACSVTASFRANATLAFRGPVLSAIAIDPALIEWTPE